MSSDALADSLPKTEYGFIIELRRAIPRFPHVYVQATLIWLANAGEHSLRMGAVVYLAWIMRSSFVNVIVCGLDGGIAALQGGSMPVKKNSHARLLPSRVAALRNGTTTPPHN
jgi:hypothetical protein